MAENFQRPSEFYNLERSDPSRWKLYTDEYGKQNWKYVKASSVEQSNFEKHQLQTGQLPTLPKPESVRDSARNCLRFLSAIQDEKSGIFPCQYGGPMFMMIGYVTAKYYADIPFDHEEKIEIIRYIVNRAHPVDGGWGLHTYGDSTAFGTAINYVILRLLGLEANHPAVAKARKCLHRLGGAIGCPLWGKVYLAVLNLYGWDGVNPSPPEFWMLPQTLTFHPGNWWVHTRAVYLPMGYLSMNRVTKSLTPLLAEIREEIYLQPFETIDFSKHRNTVCGIDLYYPRSGILNAANAVLKVYEKYLRPEWLRKKASSTVLDLILKDCKNTDWLAIAPVSNALNAIVVHCELGGNSPEFQRFLYRWPDFLFMTPEGMLLCGTNGVQVWDVAFALQYACMAGIAHEPEFRDCLVKGYRFLLDSQFTENCCPNSFRDIRKGGWPFSTKIQGFAVCDCTAEAIKAIIMVQNTPGYEFLSEEMPVERLEEGIDVLLSIQNWGSRHYGSYASYERIKGPEFLERLNPAEVFGNIMVEYPYVECTDSSILGLAYFTQHYDYRRDDIKKAIEAAIKYIKSFQRDDGSWYGSWGVCFVYAGMFAVEALTTQGEFYNNSEVIRKACEFMVSRQEDDGGWAESFRSCETHQYVRHTRSEVVQTSWAVITLLLAQYPDRKVIGKAIDFLRSKQLEDGSFPYNHAEGVFNHSCAIEYPNYKYYFPMKAFGMYANAYEEPDV